MRGLGTPMIDYIALIAEIQGHILRVRHMAAEANDSRRRDACLRVADVIEQKVRELDQIALCVIDPTNRDCEPEQFPALRDR